MNLAILTQYYPPEIGAPQARLSSLAREFVRRGHRVTVLTAMPNYPAGKIQRGYGGILLQEQHAGAKVIRTFVYPTQRTDFVHRLASYFSFVFSSAVVGSLYLNPPDYLLVESPPLFLGLSGVWLSWLKGSRLVFNVSDLWPESAVGLGLVRRGSTTHRLSSWLESFCYRRAWLVTGQTRDIVLDIATRFPRCQTFHLPNGVDCQTFRPDCATPAARQLLDKDGRCLALYAGLHGLAQGLESVVEAIEALPPESRLDLVLVGDGPEKPKLVSRVRNRKSSGVRFLAPRPHGEMPAILAAADVLIVPLARYLPRAVPSKLFEAMSTGRPVVLMAEGEAARIVRESGAGLVVAPGDVQGLAQALRTLAADAELRGRLGANGRAAALRHHDRTAIAAPFIRLLEQQLSQRAANA